MDEQCPLWKTAEGAEASLETIHESQEDRVDIIFIVLDEQTLKVRGVSLNASVLAPEG